jgi:hypothetical protein
MFLYLYLTLNPYCETESEQNIQHRYRKNIRYYWTRKFALLIFQFCTFFTNTQANKNDVLLVIPALTTTNIPLSSIDMPQYSNFPAMSIHEKAIPQLTISILF